MPLRDLIDQDYVAALKERDTTRVGTLRLLRGALQNEAIRRRADLADEEVGVVLTREANQRREAIEQYLAAGRPQLAESEANELAIIDHYLPHSLNDAELTQVVEAVLTDTNATQKGDMGKVMTALKERLVNPADVSRAARLANQHLTAKKLTPL